MSPEKLEALRRLAAHDSTPIDEARNAALEYVRGGGRVDALANDDGYKEKYREALHKMNDWSIALSEAGSILAKVNDFTRSVTYVDQKRIYVASGSDQLWLREAQKKEFGR